MNFGYFIDLHKVQLSDNNTSWIHAMTLGKYNHPLYGEINFTDDTSKAYAASVTNKVREADLDIDYDHKVMTMEAAGWIKEAKTSEDGLYVNVEWTSDAAKMIKDKKYRYFSPEFAEEWKHPRTGVVHKYVLFGGAITNRPFLRDISPLNLSEIPGGIMDPKLLRKLLKLSEDASDEAVSAKLQELAEPKTIDIATFTDAAALETRLAELKKAEKTDEPDPELVKLAETNPAIKALLEGITLQQEQIKRQGEQIATLHVSNRMNEVTVQLTEMQDKLKGIALSDDNIAKLRRLVLSVPGAAQNEVITTFTELLNGVAFTGELGRQKLTDNNGDAAKKFTDAIDAYRKEHSCSYEVAAMSVSSANPELTSEYYAQMESGEV